MKSELDILQDEMEEIRSVVFITDNDPTTDEVELVRKVGIWDFKYNWLVYPPAFKDEKAIREYCEDGLNELMVWGFEYLNPRILELIKDEYRERLEEAIELEDNGEWVESRQEEDKKKAKDDKKRKGKK